VRRMPIGVEVWRGGVNPWECDEMGHMNVRFYARIAAEGLAAIAPHLTLDDAFSEGAGSTLLVRDQHIRYLREARSRAALYMTAQIVEMAETEAKVLLLLVHAGDDQPCASFMTRVSHVTTVEGRPFPWPKAARQAAIELMAPAPDFAQARSVPDGPFETTASLSRADQLSLTTLGAGVLTRRDLDLFGRMDAELFIGRISDGVIRLALPFREAVVAHAAVKPAQVGGAMLEFRVVHLDWPKAGDRFVIRSGVAGVDSRGQRLIHWLLDPASGRPWAVGHAYMVTLDLDARRIAPVSEAAQAIIRTQIPDGLAL
jgi:acyl-CoA thioester hydrolase